MEKAMLVFQTDFTCKEGAVASMYGVVKSVDRKLEIITATHEIPRYDTWSASCRLLQYVPFWPKGTVFVSVVDPGVGTERRASVALTRGGYYIVTPDNGSLTHLLRFEGIQEIREIDESVNRLKGKGTEAAAVFHGRDLFAYCASRLAAGIITFDEVGKSYPVETIVTHPLPEPVLKDGALRGMIEITDPNFGNAWTNIPLELFRAAGFSYGDTVHVVISRHGTQHFQGNIPFLKTFGLAEKGKPLVYTNELLRIGLSLSQDNFCKKYSIGYGPDWRVEFMQ